MSQYNGNTKRKEWKHLSEKERYQIESLLKARHSPKEIAELIGRDRRTVEREILRGAVTQRDSLWKDSIVYLADTGQSRAEENAANKGRGLKIGHDHALARHLEKRIGEDGYSPDATIGEIRAKGLKFAVTLCTKTVYNMIDRGDFLNITNRDLPVKKDRKRRKCRKPRRVALHNLRGRSIEERSQAANGRTERGHWEMDMVVGTGKACLLVMTERMSRKELIFRLPDKRQAGVAATLDRLERKHGRMFREMFRTITMDNGSEFLDCEALEASCLNSGGKRTVCHYAHPYSSWERGSNENANRLIRRFVPRGTDIGKLKQKDIKRIEQWMNSYPRRMFGYKTADDIYYAA
jgi:IS30 family transposase